LGGSPEKKRRNTKKRIGGKREEEGPVRNIKIKKKLRGVEKCIEMTLNVMAVKSAKYKSDGQRQGEVKRVGDSKGQPKKKFTGGQGGRGEKKRGDFFGKR